MKFAFLTFLVISAELCAQPLADRKIRLALILPDTMTIDNRLLEYAKAIEFDYVNDYYNLLKSIERRLKSVELSDSLNRLPLMKREMRMRLDSVRGLEGEAKRYKYFYKLADYSLHHLKSGCSQNTPGNEFLVIGAKKPSKKKFKEILEKFNLDYLVRYTEIDAKSDDTEYKIKCTITLYSKNLDLLLKKEFSATGIFPNDRVKCNTPLCCMLTNLAMLTTTRICEALSEIR